jgi:hypothetical protein
MSEQKDERFAITAFSLSEHQNQLILVFSHFRF